MYIVHFALSSASYSTNWQMVGAISLKRWHEKVEVVKISSKTWEQLGKILHQWPISLFIIIKYSWIRKYSRKLQYGGPNNF